MTKLLFGKLWYVLHIIHLRIMHARKIKMEMAKTCYEDYISRAHSDLFAFIFQILVNQKRIDSP